MSCKCFFVVDSTSRLFVNLRGSHEEAKRRKGAWSLIGPSLIVGFELGRLAKGEMLPTNAIGK